MKLIIDVPNNEILIGWYTHFDGVNQYHKAKTLGEPNYIPLEQIRNEIERLHYHPKLDFIKNDEVVEMALDIIDKYKGDNE